MTSLLVVAVAGKAVGGIHGSATLKSIRQQLLIGTNMVPRGEVILVIAGLGFAQGYISHHVLVALVLVTIGAALIGPLLSAPLAKVQSRWTSSADKA